MYQYYVLLGTSCFLLPTKYYCTYSYYYTSDFYFFRSYATLRFRLSACYFPCITLPTCSWIYTTWLWFATHYYALLSNWYLLPPVCRYLLLSILATYSTAMYVLHLLSPFFSFHCALATTWCTPYGRVELSTSWQNLDKTPKGVPKTWRNSWDWSLFAFFFHRVWAALTKIFSAWPTVE